MAPRTIGLFGGTFDPPHLGHVAAVHAVLDALAVSELVVTVAGEPQGKGRPVASAPRRLEMAQAAFAAIERVAVSDLEVRRGGPTFTIDTVEALLSATPDAEVLLVVGADAARSLGGWHRSADLAGLVTVAVVPRLDLEPSVPAAFSFRLLKMAPVDLSSTGVRAALQAGERPEGLVPSPVVPIILENRLYSP